MKTRAVVGSLLTGIAWIVGCSSSDPLQGSNSASGQVSGHSLEVQDAVVKMFPAGSPGGLGVARVFLVLSSAGALCVDYEAAVGVLQHKNETRLTLDVHFAGEPAPGTYAVDPQAPSTTSHASGQFAVVDEKCASVFAQDTDGGGSVTITTLTASEIAGTYIVKFKGGGSLEGSFHRSPCPNLPDRSAPGCK